MTTDNQRAGQEEYLYRDMMCCLHPCSVKECPEIICALDFPGGMPAYLRYQEIRKVFISCTDINEAAKMLGIDPSNARKRFKWYQYVTESIQGFSLVMQ